MSAFRRMVIPILFLSLHLAACDDRQSANEKTFERALQTYYDGHPECIALPIDLSSRQVIGPRDPMRQQVEALAEAGLLSSAPGESGATVYSATAAGQNAIHGSADRFLGGSMLCYARRKVVKVASFSPPADFHGMKASSATYDYELLDIEPWAKSDTIQRAFPTIKDALAQTRHRETAGLVLVDDDWRDERALK